jgi:hypothetical protein
VDAGADADAISDGHVDEDADGVAQPDGACADAAGGPEPDAGGAKGEPGVSAVGLPLIGRMGMKRLWVALVVCGLLLGGLAAAAAAQSGPVDAVLTVGDRLDVVVTLTNTDTLIDAVADYVDYDPAVWRFAGAAPISPTVWTYTLTNTRPGQFDFLLLATDAPMRPGASGDVLTFTLQAMAPVTRTEIYVHQMPPRQSGGAYRGAWSGEIRPVTRTVQIAARYGTPDDPDGNGVLDLRDFSLLASAWQARAGDGRYTTAADVSRDGVIDETDLRLVWAALLRVLGQ